MSELLAYDIGVVGLDTMFFLAGTKQTGMGLFNALGRKVESVKQQIDVAATGAYACEECEEMFHTAQDTCPTCGANAVETV